jgi:hypothetical protein
LTVGRKPHATRVIGREQARRQSAEPEQVRVLQEEIPLFWKEQRDEIVDGHDITAHFSDRQLEIADPMIDIYVLLAQ